MYAAVVGNDRFLSIGKNISIMIHWSTGRQRQRHILTSRPLPVSVIDNGHRPRRDLLREDQRRSGDMSDLGMVPYNAEGRISACLFPTPNCWSSIPFQLLLWRLKRN